MFGKNISLVGDIRLYRSSSSIHPFQLLIFTQPAPSTQNLCFIQLQLKTCARNSCFFQLQLQRLQTCTSFSQTKLLLTSNLDEFGAQNVLHSTSTSILSEDSKYVLHYAQNFFIRAVLKTCFTNFNFVTTSLNFSLYFD